jgi:DNA polymerase-3 subunit epsilon
MQQNRYVCLDTETTGLRVTAGSRMIEIGMVEVIDGKITNRQYQSHLKCNEKLSDVVKKISNITDEMLIGKPDFSEIANDVMNFLNKDANGNESKATLVIHNEKFDLSFLNFHLQE